MPIYGATESATPSDISLTILKDMLHYLLSVLAMRSYICRVTQGRIKASLVSAQHWYFSVAILWRHDTTPVCLFSPVHAGHSNFYTDCIMALSTAGDLVPDLCYSFFWQAYKLVTSLHVSSHHFHHPLLFALTCAFLSLCSPRQFDACRSMSDTCLFTGAAAFCHLH